MQPFSEFRPMFNFLLTVLQREDEELKGQLADEERSSASSGSESGGLGIPILLATVMKSDLPQASARPESRNSTTPH